jgi:magnesium transporter
VKQTRKEALMTNQVKFYLSRVIGTRVSLPDGKTIGKINDFVISNIPSRESEEPARTIITSITVKGDHIMYYLNAADFTIEKKNSGYTFVCNHENFNAVEDTAGKIMLRENVLDKQIVDINGRKLVRVNDVQLVHMENSIYVVAVDTGLEGLLRRIGISRPINYFLKLIKVQLPSEFILWEDIAAVDIEHTGIRLSKTHNKLNRLHPSDLADIIEELGYASRTNVFKALDEEQAADVLEELEQDEQVEMIESLPVEKAADVLEKMPADEAADIIEELEVDRAEKLLKEMEPESSEEVRELLEYPANRVGSIMTTDYLSFRQSLTVNDVLAIFRSQKPEPHMMYSLLITDENDRFLSTVSLRDLVISEPQKMLKDIMERKPLYIHDNDKLDSLAEMIDKYSLLALPVINKDRKLEGIVVVEDIVEDLLGKRKTK